MQKVSLIALGAVVGTVNASKCDVTETNVRLPAPRLKIPSICAFLIWQGFGIKFAYNSEVVPLLNS